MGSKSGGATPQQYQDTYLKSVFAQANQKGPNKKASPYDSSFDLANLEQYKDTAKDYLGRTNAANYGATAEMQKFLSNVEALSLDADTASIGNMEFGDINLAGLQSGVTKGAQNEFMEQMKTIFENRKKSILDRTLRPGQAATRGQSL